MATDKKFMDRIAEATSGFINKFIIGKKAVRAFGVTTTIAGNYRNIFSVSYNGEKNLGEMGPIKDYVPDYYLLSLRSWQAMTESEMAVTIVNKKVLWVISKGLKLQSHPVKEVLASEGIQIDSETFNTLTEARFQVWANSRRSSYSGMSNLHDIAKDAYKNAKVGGDCLVVLRLSNGIVNIELVDGAHVQSPQYGSDYFPAVLDNGNIIRHGIEMTPSGQHVAYHVNQLDGKFKRIPARDEVTGMIIAFLVYGNKGRLNNHRGLPLIAVTLETIKKLERYKEAAVGSAEERAKIAYFIEHGPESTGEHPAAKQMAYAFNASLPQENSDDLPIDVNGNQMANQIQVTTNKQTFNMPQDSRIKSLEAKNEMFFKEFYSTNADVICAAFGIPPNVAFSIYNDSFSASRAATKDWEHTIDVDREDITFQFYQPIYNLWLFAEIIQSKIPALGYLKAWGANNFMAMEAFQTARFTGSKFPHIDPLKEVQAERLKLGTSGAAIPLTTVEAATESLNGGDSGANIEQYSLELKKTKGLEIEAPAPAQITAEPAPDKKDEKQKD